MNRRLIAVLIVGGWGLYTWGHNTGWQRAKGKKPMVGKIFSSIR